MTTQTEPTFEPTEEEAAFRICDDDSANWYLRKLANIASEKARIEAQAARMVAALDADAERLEYLFGPQLQAYCRQKIQESKRNRKTVDFLQGRCQFRTVCGGLFIVDPTAALEWARKNARQAIRTEERLDGDLYRAVAEKALQNGEAMPPGADRRPNRETFSVSFGKE